MVALYGTIWLALVLFAAGEFGRARSPAARWGWPAFAGGLVLAIVHTLLSFAIVHRWSHADAVAATAAQTAAVYGASFGGGLYVNYAFFAVWFADAAWWRLSASSQIRPPALMWTVRAFYIVIIVNAAVVFAGGWRRAAGVAVVAAILLAWSRGSRRAPS